MKKISTILILSFICFQTFGQTSKKNNQKKHDDFIQQFEEINMLLKQYDTLSPFRYHEDAEGYIKESDLIDSIQNEITTSLLKVLNDKRILNYQIENLITGDELIITKSADNKVYFFSIDEKTGGTYRSSKVLIHYRPSNGIVKAEVFGVVPLDELEEGRDTINELEDATYNKVYLLDNVTQKYFVIGGLMSCSTCLSSLALTLQIDTDSINTELIARYDGRFDDLKVFDYNSTLMEFDYEYYAADNDDMLYGGDNQKEGLKHRYKNKFKYLNGEFVQVEKKEFWDKKEE